MGPDPENRVGDQDTGSPGRPVSSGLQVPGEPGHCRARTRPPWWTSSGVFPSIAPAEMSDTPRWLSGPLKDNQWGCHLDPNKIDARTFPADFCTRDFLGRGEPLCACTLIVALSPGHSDITRFRPWPPIVTGNHLDRAEKIPKFAQSGTVNVFDPRSGISGPTSWRSSACPNLHEWWTQPAHVRCPVVQLLIYPKSGGLPRLVRKFYQ